MEIVTARCAGLDVHKKTVMGCIRSPSPDGGRTENIREFSTFTRDLRSLGDWLVAHDITQVAMEATGSYWKPVWHVLETYPSLELMLVNPGHVKAVPGRKTDVKDAAWLAQLAECGLLRASFIPPREIFELRDLTRYRKKLIQMRSSETQRVQKVLEDGGIKLDSVISDVLGVSGREMLEALITGVKDVEVMSQMARTRMRSKIPELQLALEGGFNEHHAQLLRRHLNHIDYLAKTIDSLDADIAAKVEPNRHLVDLLCTIPGVSTRTAEVILAEIGTDMSRFPSAQALSSWAGMCPGNHESAGKRRSGRPRKGASALRVALCEAAWAAARTKDTYLSAQFRRFCRRFGKKSERKAAFALGQTILGIVWHVLKDQTPYEELGSDYFERRHNDKEAHTRRLVAQLNALGHNVTLEPKSA
jgi:transposase